MSERGEEAEHPTNATGSPSTATGEEQQVQDEAASIIEEPRFRWVRPNMREYQARINLYVRVEVMNRVRQKLHGIGSSELKQRFLDGVFGHLVQLRRSGSANNALSELIARELHDASFSEFEKRFFVGGHEVSFTAQDYALVTGLRFGPSDFDTTADHVIPQSSLYMRHFDGKRVSINTLEQKFNDGLFRDPEDLLKVAHILILYHILICRGESIWIDEWVWALVEDSEAWARFPWGSYNFSILCHQMSVLVKHPNQIKNNRKTYHIFGPVWAFQIWSYEVIPKLGGLCGNRDSEMSIPRCLHWDTRAVPSIDFSELFDRQLIIRPMVPTPREEGHEFFISLGTDQQMAVTFRPSKRHAAKKLLVDEDVEVIEEESDEPPKRKRRREPCHKTAPKSRTAVEKRHHPEPSAAAEKRQRRHSPEPPQPSTTCCLHGNPCKHADDEEAHLERLARRVAPRIPLDDLESGWIARLAHKFQLRDGQIAPSSSVYDKSTIREQHSGIWTQWHSGCSCVDQTRSVSHPVDLLGSHAASRKNMSMIRHS
ncbi:uncharacterized protein LOC131003707 [Salvia miltiorrhiza]|uniref:uncharacterized protein LOC131003707 n=1 Tax=Salvia miltiorrhiza TaxID=226208 RepID=UPI0025AC344F|nr:uncharacterized protein LOC131003707 [Salvia miltiorrhiza]